MSFYGHQSVQNNTFQELLIFRSRYDANTTVADADSELTGGKMFWVKTIKDYPYVEISHGKPKLETTNVFTVDGNNQYNTKVNTTNSDLKFGETITVPNLEIADTGHIIGAKEQNLNLPHIYTNKPILIDLPEEAHIVTLSHATKGYSSESPTYNLVTTPTLQPALNEIISFNLPTFDEWGHYYNNQSQSIQMPNVSVESPLSATIDNRDNRTTIIKHNTAASVAPAFAATINTSLASARTYTTQLGEINYLSVAGTDNYGHANRQVDLPFQINHSTNYKLQDISSYLTPIAEIPSKNEAQTNLRLELRVSYAPGRSYFPVTQNQLNTIDLVLQNNEYNINTTKIPKLAFVIDDTKLNNINWTFTPESNNCIQPDTAEQLYIINTIPTIGNKITLGHFTINLSSTEFKEGSLFINGKNQLNQAKLLIVNSNSIPDQSADGIEIWDANKLLYLPKLQITDEGHVEKIGDMFIALGNIGNSGNSGNNDNSGGSNNNGDSGDDGSSNDTANKLSTRIRFQVIPTLPTSVSEPMGRTELNIPNLEIDIRVPSTYELTPPWTQLYVGDNNYTEYYSLGQDITQVEYQIPKSAVLCNFTYEHNNITYYLDYEAISQNWAGTLSLLPNMTNTTTLNLPLTTIEPTPEYSTLDLIKVQTKMKFEGPSNNVRNRIYFTLYSGAQELLPLTKDGELDEPMKLNIASLSNGLYTAECYINTEFLQRVKGVTQNYQLRIQPHLSPLSGEQLQVIQNTTCTFDQLEKVAIITNNNGWPEEVNMGTFTASINNSYATSADKTTTNKNTVQTNTADSTETEMRLSALERNMVQVNTIADPELITKLTSRVELIEGTLAPLGYDDNGAFTSINKLDDISTYKNGHDDSISLEESYKQLLLCYTGLVRAVGEKLYGSNSSNLNGFIDAFTLDHYKGPTAPSYLPAGTVPEFTPTNNGGN